MRPQKTATLFIAIILSITFIVACNAKPLSEFDRDDLQNSLLTPNNLTFGDVYKSSDWTSCPTSEDNFSDQRYNASQIEPSAQVFVGMFSTKSDCSSGGGRVVEVIFLFSSSRQAQRYLETAKIQEQKIPLFPYEVLGKSKGGSDFWIMRAKSSLSLLLY